MPRHDPCPRCNAPKQKRAKACWPCNVAERRAKAEQAERAVFEGRPVQPITNFEPQAAPPEEWAGRPWNDERNNYRMPNWNKGQPIRDLVAAPLRVAVVDIETTDLWAGMGRVLCSNRLAWDPYESRTFRADDYPAWRAGKRSDDSEIVRDILQDLEQFDIVYAYNGTNFDFPFLRTRALIHGFPPVYPKKIIDPVWHARKIFRMRSNRLDAVARTLGCPYEKTDVDQDLWARAMLDGDKHCMDEIVHHCELDVQVLAWVSKKISPYVRQIDAIGSFRQ